MINKLLVGAVISTIFYISCSPDIDNANSKGANSSDKNNFIEMGKMELDSSNGKYVIVSSKDFIEKNNLHGKVDSAIWIVYLTSILSDNEFYCFHVDNDGFLIEDTLNFINSYCPTSLDLYLKEIRFEEDVMLFTFTFLNKERNRFCGSPQANTTIGFIKNDKMIYRGGGDYEAFLQGCKLQKEAELEQRDKVYDSPKSDYTLHYYNNILQKYLDTTSCKINPWFKKEATKRGFHLN